jgi:ketosteroid isomerase-like protein
MHLRKATWGQLLKGTVSKFWNCAIKAQQCQSVTVFTADSGTFFQLIQATQREGSHQKSSRFEREIYIGARRTSKFPLKELVILKHLATGHETMVS